MANHCRNLPQRWPHVRPTAHNTDKSGVASGRVRPRNAIARSRHEKAGTSIAGRETAKAVRPEEIGVQRANGGGFEVAMKALILVDLQNDFMPGGALTVPEGNAVVKVANRLLPRFDLVVATQDWHPPAHGSFASSHEGKNPGDTIDLNGLRQELWPDHCIQNGEGAAFHRDLNRKPIDRVFHKGTNPSLDSYSAFFDNAHRGSTGLSEYLKENGVTAVYIMGLATDYCVKFSALDAVRLGLETYVVTDGCRGIDLNPGDINKVWEEMRQAGVKLVEAEALERPTKSHREDVAAG